MANQTINQTIQYCLCGCGNPTPLAKNTCKRDGTIKGRPVNWLKGHHIRVNNPHGPVPVKDRFWKHVKRNENSSQCWEWTARRDGDDYGQVQVEGKTRGAHRIAYELAKGMIPQGQVVRHTCDNPPCCNPAHLITGTAKQNSADAKARGRIRNYSHLTAANVAEMRQLRELEKLPIDRIAKQFNVSYAAAWRILNYRCRVGRQPGIRR